MRILSFVCLLIFGVVDQASVGPQTVQHKKRQPEAAIIWSGNQMNDLCQHYREDKYKSQLGTGCAMYIAGATQTVIMSGGTEDLPWACPGTGVNQEQITDVVVKWLTDHPEKRDLPAPVISAEAMHEAWPCE
jgi:hypothetical protein